MLIVFQIMMGDLYEIFLFQQAARDDSLADDLQMTPEHSDDEMKGNIIHLMTFMEVKIIDYALVSRILPRFKCPTSAREPFNPGSAQDTSILPFEYTAFLLITPCYLTCI